MRTVVAAPRRRDIQVLRAAAAVGVVLFHLWPGRLGGGFAGVDVFFVISGFLITGGLVRPRSGGIGRTLRAFWVRRIRRLLPVAMTVILATVAAILILAPEAVGGRWISEAVTSTLYVENWALALQSVDYWAADAVASPFQHYWSLSVEEQFYLLWPVLLIGAGLLSPRRGFVFVTAVVGIASFAYAVVHPWSGLYFDTFARAWEFAVGAGLALLPEIGGRRWRVPVALVGWIAIALAFAVLSEAAGVPRWAALLPVLGAAAVILAAVDVGPRPVTRLGDISYPLYLWHWPLVVLAPVVLARELGSLDKIVILLLTIALAELTHRFIEEPLRVRTAAALSVTAAVTVVVLVASGVGLYRIDRAAHADEEAVEQRLALNPECFGAAAAINGCDGEGDVLPSLANWQADIPDAPECYSQSPEAPTVTCTFGDGPTRVAVIGNSHGELLVQGFRDHVDDYGWTMDTFVGRGGVFRWGDGIPDTVIDDALAGGAYDLVIVAYNRADENYYETPEGDIRTAPLERAFARTTALGIPVVALGDNPTVPATALACVASGADPRSCSFDAADGFRYHDPLRTAAATTGAAMIEFDDLYCGRGRCPMVIGDVLVYRDENHLTSTFMRTLAPFVMTAAMEAAGLPVPSSAR